MKLKFSLIINSNDDTKNYNKLVNKFNYLGNDYIKINPRPFVTIDISKSTEDGWSSNQSVNLNKQSLFLFIRILERMIKQFKSIKELFYYQNDKLTVNNRISKEITMDFVSCNKHIRLQPCVVSDDEINNKFYEGCVFCINSYDNFCYITYEEMEYLYYELSHIDMMELSLSVINTVNLFRNAEEEIIKPKPVKKEEDYEDIIENSPYVKIEEANTIPDI
jgi:hypothetical protein